MGRVVSVFDAHDRESSLYRLGLRGRQASGARGSPGDTKSPRPMHTRIILNAFLHSLP